MSTPNASKRLAGTAPPSDAGLVRRAARRDERAFAAIFRRYHQEIYRFCLALLGNREDACDALQNTMLKALQALPGEQRVIQLRPWLYRVAHNESVEILRGRGRIAPLGAELADPATGLAETVAERERLRQLLRDLADLPERQRAALVLRELSGLGFAQIGEFLGGSEAIARQAVYEARLSLRRLEAGRAMSCEEVVQRLSDADGRVRRRRDLRAHLRDCRDCRAFREAIESRRRDFAAVAPLPALASAGILHAALGGGAGATAGTSTAGGATVAAGAGKAVTAGALAKSVAAVAVVAAVGVSAADRSGLVHTGLTGGSSGATPPARVQPGSDGGPESGSGSGLPSGSGSAARSGPSGSKAAQEARHVRDEGVPAHDGGNAPDPTSEHGQGTAITHGQGPPAGRGGGHGRHRGSTHTGSDNASHPGHAWGRTKPKHDPPPERPSRAPDKPKHEGGKRQTSEEPPSPTEGPTGPGKEKGKSGVESEGMP